MDTDRQIEKAVEWVKVYTSTVDKLAEFDTEAVDQDYKGNEVVRTKLGFDTNKEVAALILVQLMEKAYA